ncbi:type I polyketide synthase [Catenulispora subtropica]|uniref:Type I polyketide synthase n=1 Tax=Catenulispora subtropica TaxID=450798 RepID=A0ABP5EEY4_9ACTN
MSIPRVAVVGIACRYPDAASPKDLWENVLAGRRAFRRLPDERMRAEDYYSPDPAAPDRFYSPKAAVIDGFAFDRVEYRVAGSTFRSTDMTHWLALDTAARALADAGFPEGRGLPARTTGVIVGNSLTGEFTRANLMRLRWPYVRRTVSAALREHGLPDAEIGPLLSRLEQRYKAPFPAIDEDTLAGGLANTIAGRICNHFDLAGGGYTVDGACSSSLLSVATACEGLVSGRLDAALAGGVDLSIDPFEVIGFAKTGALATGEMRVYDKHSNGFWPGEGCGMLVLMRDEDARERGLFRYATIAGWGTSSDGRGGITRPEASGHRLAIERAYAMAGFGFETVSYLEGHGTGTAVGDATELRAFTEARRAAAADAPPAAISTVKGNFGHTKAAAGVAGLIKAVLAVRHQVIPPATGHVEPHPQLLPDADGRPPALHVPDTARLWPAGAPIRAAVSSMGFGGINAHVVVEHADGARRDRIGPTVSALVRSRQDAEVLLVDAPGIAELRGKLAQLAALTAKLSYAELGDLAATLSAQARDGAADQAGRAGSAGPVRAAVVASSPEEAARKVGRLLSLLDAGTRRVVDVADGVFLGGAGTRPRIGFLFPGQGAGRRGDGGALRRRFAEVDELYRELALPEGGDLVATEVAQPRIVTSSVAGLRILARLGIEADGAVGHSLGEITALHWAGAMDEDALLEIAAARGAIMAAASAGDGAMAGLGGPPEAVEPLLAGEPVVIAGYNSPRQTVVSGPAEAVARVGRRAEDAGLTVTPVAVSHAFHSAAVAPAASEFQKYLVARHFETPRGRVLSTVTAGPLAPDADLPELLGRQMRQPVRFSAAAAALAADADLLLEVGPGRVLNHLAAEIAPDTPVVSLQTDSTSLAGLLRAVGAAFVLGAPVRHRELFAERFVRPLPLDKEFAFFASPCEAVPGDEFSAVTAGAVAAGEGTASGSGSGSTAGGSAGDGSGGALELLLRLSAERAELPIEAVRPDSNPVDELHLSSITVGQIVNQAARELGITAPLAPSAFATATLSELAGELETLRDTAQPADDGQWRLPAGVGPWIRAFAVDLVPAKAGAPVARTEPSTSGAEGRWRVFAPDGHPFAAELAAELRRADVGDGVLLCTPSPAGTGIVPGGDLAPGSSSGLMLRAAREALSASGPVRFVAVGDRRTAAGLAKTLHLEAPHIPTTVVTLPEGTPADQAVASIVDDVAATEAFSEVCYDLTGVRKVPQLRALPPEAPAAAHHPLGPGDVLLVTGGGKGITAEAALAVGRGTGAAVAILGRSDPARDQELTANLERMAAAGVVVHYARADVTAPQEVRAAVAEIQHALGPVTGVLHGAGRNVPVALAALEEKAFDATLAPKITGLRTVLEAVDAERLKLLVTFGSIIGRAGLRGQADYAVANDWMTEVTREFQAAHPDCRCLALEWSVWSGTGMGERLGVLEALTREGIEPIPAADGVALLGRMLADPGAPTAAVVMGRAGTLPTITLPATEPELLRFLDRVRVHYAGVEIVVDSDLSADADPYLADHELDGDLLYPAVLGMEAMAQAASALTGRRDTPVLEDVEFLRPIVVPPRETTTIRVAALVGADGAVRAVIRSGETGFQADHFRATLRYDGPVPAALPGADRGAGVALPLDPGAELYGPVLFQGARFQRLRGYRYLRATECVADLDPTAAEPWFGPYLPSELVLADPGTRDAVMHALQCCVPDATLLPSGIERLRPADPEAVRDLRALTLHAIERHRDGDTYVYDIDVRGADGVVVERWRGLTLQAVRKQDGSGPWAPVLLGPFLERLMENTTGVLLRAAVLPGAGVGTAGRRGRTAESVTGLLGDEVVVRYRPDGMPETDTGYQVSASHGAGLTFAVAGPLKAVSCDVESAVPRSDTEWSDLLGRPAFELARLVAREAKEDPAVAATRLWGASEAVRKAGRARVDLVVDGYGPGGAVRFRSGAARITTFATAVRGTAGPVVFTMLAEEE